MSISSSKTKVFREAIIREQLLRMFPWVPKIDVLFCANEMARQVEGFHANENFEGGKC